jgi:hypothetical protein
MHQKLTDFNKEGETNIHILHHYLTKWNQFCSHVNFLIFRVKLSPYFGTRIWCQQERETLIFLWKWNWVFFLLLTITQIMQRLDWKTENLWYNVFICKLPAPVIFNSFSVNEIDKLTKQIHLGMPHSHFNGAQSVPFC